MSSADPPSSLAAPVPLFPLPSVHLFPHALLPLHVFEPRYRDLVRDTLAQSQLIALPLLLPGYEEAYQGRPPVRAVCGFGSVIAHESLPDGRCNILVRGLGRARIAVELPPDKPYRLARLDAIADAYAAGFDRDEAMRTLVLLADQLAARLPAGGETLRRLSRSERDPGPLCDVLAAALVTAGDERQWLLETADVEARALRLSQHVAAMLAQFVAHKGQPN